MEGAEYVDTTSRVYQHPVLTEARRLFHAFYSFATLDDQMRFDTLMMAYTALTVAIAIPRAAAVDPPQLERDCDTAEQQFMRARGRVRECPTFAKLGPGDQKRFAAILFERYPTTE